MVQKRIVSRPDSRYLAASSNSRRSQGEDPLSRPLTAPPRHTPPRFSIPNVGRTLYPCGITPYTYTVFILRMRL